MEATLPESGAVSGAPPRTRVARRTRSRSARDAWVFVACVAPNVALIIAFIYRPLISNIYYSTLNWSLGDRYATRVGFGNYVQFFTGSDAGTILGTTAIFTIATVGGSMIIGLALSLVLNQRLIGRGFARATVFAPYVLSGVGIGLVWTFIFDPTTGALSDILRGLGLSAPNWFGNPHLTLLMVIIVYVWKNLGYCAVIYLAALQAVPVDVLEAASIDGAGAWNRFWRVTLPLISPTTFFLLLTTILSSLQAFDLLYIISPQGYGTNTLMFATYYQAFQASQAGYSAAISTILFAILLIMTVIQMVLIERRVHYR
ncbi:glycerol-3-phosphate ABC transporter permease [Microlunatus endophyticus]|uniref:Glycerol-3-phosphate ABC transporter permease n=1 Tax=Microlunatus endophyticus TaxID=1716077 RepID=A0A917S8V8_9ACTN|nr:sugar ABC transporter permease [Microlunatus endophyticus]GGL64484.1 glycerol-3-phosphate ABC transporter permease [Microlunatus endophyticus]